MAKTCSAFGKYIPRRARPAAAGFCSSALSIAIYSLSFCSCILSHLSSFSSCCAPLFLLLTVGVARQQPVHRGQANFLPAVILFRPSLPLSLCSAHRVNPPPSGAEPSLLALLSSRPLSITAPSVSPPFLLPRHPGRRILTAVRHVLLPLPTTSYCYYFPGYRSLTPFLPVLLAMMQRALSISATLIDDNNFLAPRLPGFLVRDHATYLASFAGLVNEVRRRASCNY